MTDLSGKLKLIPESLNDFLIRCDFRFDELYGYFFIDLSIHSFVHPSHAPFAQLLDDLVAVGKCGACCELLFGCFCGLGDVDIPG